MKKVLVTGSNGLLGQKITDLYTGHHRERVKLIATGKGPDRYPSPGLYVYDEMDISNRDQVKEVLATHRPDCIIHTAAMTNVDQCETDHQGCDLMNVKAVRYLLEEAAIYNSHFLHLSTDFIFDGEAGPYNEEAKPHPVSYYGQAKLKGEELVKNYGGTFSILRTILVYGVVKDMSRTNIVLWAKNSLEKRREINAVNDQFRTPTLAEDLAQGCMLAELRQAQGIYNLGGNDFMSIYDLVCRVADYWSLDRKLIQTVSSDTLQQTARRPRRTGLDLAKSMRELGYRPHTFEEGLELMDKQLQESKKTS